MFFFFAVLGLELRALHLLGGCSTSPVFECMEFLWAGTQCSILSLVKSELRMVTTCVEFVLQLKTSVTV
jgi:hypothetical protein